MMGQSDSVADERQSKALSLLTELAATIFAVPSLEFNANLIADINAKVKELEEKSKVLQVINQRNLTVSWRKVISANV